MATKETIEKISENEKLIKSSFQMEFERFQQYLKDQNSRFSKQDTKMREIEKQLKQFNELGGIEELSKFMQEIQAEKASQYVPKSQHMQQTIGKMDSGRGGGGGGDNFGKTVVTAMNATINSALLGRGDMQGGAGIDNRTFKYMQDML